MSHPTKRVKKRGNMNKCERCNINVLHEKHCPLCGKFVNGEAVKETSYPKVDTSKNNRLYAIRIIFGLLILLNVLVVSLELIITQTFYYSWHIIVPSILLCISVYFPIKKNWGVFGAFCISIVVICAYLIFLELFTNTFGWALNYVIPLFLLGSEIFILVLLAISKFEKVEMQLPLVICEILSLANFLFIYLSKLVYWPSAASLLFGFAVLFIIFVVKNRRAKKNLQKSFHV